MVMTSPAGVVFDLDGTLVLTESRNAVVWRRFFEANGIGYDDDLAHHVTGRRAQDSLVELTHLFPDRPMDELLSQVAAVELTVPLSDVQPVAGAVRAANPASGTPTGGVMSACPNPTVRGLVTAISRDGGTEPGTWPCGRHRRARFRCARSSAQPPAEPPTSRPSP